MSGPVAAALALAAAALLGVSPRRRIAPNGRAPGGRAARRAGGWSLIGTVAGAAVLAALALPLSTWLAGVLLGATAALRHRRGLRRRRAVAESRALETALDALAGELRVGAHPVRAFAIAAAESHHPAVAAGLGGVAARARLGADVATGLRDAAASSALPSQWERLAAYWQLGGQHGVAIATLMHAAQRDITARQRFSARAEAGMAGARASATLLAGLPLLGVLLGQLIGARPVAFLLGGAGGVLALVGVGLVCVGLLWSDRITAQAVT
ncbi:type II secretion system F family protein [Mycolicibacter heraklionensis]|uniref:Type II secretion system F family protein n=1 Tax=Mycolicibacter heraklionensis TaxID=512402 RepID=A0A9X7WFT6_9MYCO|nr:type II secretion system F family protein [Mycolicibacter heraklionensis]QZA07481.1 type II secretion system F family protein [Mycolicibacter heraklionensis]